MKSIGRLGSYFNPGPSLIIKGVNSERNKVGKRSAGSSPYCSACATLGMVFQILDLFFKTGLDSQSLSRCGAGLKVALRWAIKYLSGITGPAICLDLGMPVPPRGRAGLCC